MLIRAQAVDSGVFACASTTPQNHYVSVINVVDPFNTSGTQQPLGYDQWKTLYKRAKVLGAKVTFTCHNAGAVAVVIGCTLIPEGENAAQTPWEYNAESPNSRYRILSPEMDHTTIGMVSSTKKYFRIADIKDNEEIACDIDADTGPDRVGYFTCWAALHNGTTATNVDYIIKVQYIILLDQPQVPARSDGV